MDELVTIIVPVYNSRDYVSRCVASLTGQAYADLQIVLVDDGSQDGSGELCDAFAKQDGRIEVIHRENGGVSSARNAGLDIARGAWIAFVDSDDYVSPYYIEEMLTAAKGGCNCDMAICGFAWVQERDEAAPFSRTSETQEISGREACVARFGKQIPLYNRCWGKLFRADLWDGLRFPEGMTIGEDIFVSHTLLYRAGRIAITDAVLYAYVQSDGSIMRSEFSPRRLEALDSWQQGVRFFSAAGETDLANIARRVYCSRVLDARCICRRLIPNEREVLRMLRNRAAEAYRDAKPARRYIDCSKLKAHGYRLKFFLGRWCPPPYSLLFVGKRTNL